MKVSRIILAGILILPPLEIAASLLGDTNFLPVGSVQINLHYQPQSQTAESLALKRLADAVQSHPNTQHFRVRWVQSFFFGWMKENQNFIEYDRKTGDLTEASNDPMGDRPTQQWSNVRDTLLSGLAKNGFQSRYLTDAGCKSELP